VLLAVVAALVVVLLRPLPGRAMTGAHAGHRHGGKTKPKRGRHLSARAAASESLGHRIVSYARHFLGVPYSYGGVSPRTGFDCSGFVRYVYGHFGISLPHSSFADLWRGRRISRENLRPGDLVFFNGAGHVGIYIGGGRFIDAPHTGTVVRISTMSWYGASYYGARRLRGT
jgi:peptidoglycan DL-endopeptidase CwlO